VAVCLAAFAAPLGHQAAHNWARFHIMTPLIKESLGQSQLNWGKDLIRYVTVVRDNQALPRPYHSPWSRPEEDVHFSRFWVWYVEHPAAAVKTLGWRLATIFDHDRPTPYAESDFPWYRYPASLFNMALNACGLVGLWAAVRSARRSQRWVAAFYISMLLPFLSLHLWVAYEARMGLPMFTLLCVFVPLGFARLRAGKRPWVLSALGLYVLVDQYLLWQLSALH
jgi:hypothetical protein